MINLMKSLNVTKQDELLYILCYLVSDVVYKTIGETVFIKHAYNLSDIESDIGYRFDVHAIIKQLNKEGKVKLRGDEVFVGVKKGVRKFLYANSEDSDDALTYLKPFYFSYLSNSPKKEAHLSDLWSELEYMAETVINLTVDDFLRVYSLAYEFVCQEPLRQFQSKEVGQMKNFVKLYTPKESFDLIMYYLTNSEKFKYAMSIGTLLIKKDEVREAMKHKRKKLAPKNYRRDDDF